MAAFQTHDAPAVAMSTVRSETLLAESLPRIESVVSPLRDKAVAQVIRAGLPSLGDSVRLVVSELVTNAVRYGADLKFSVTIRRAGINLRIEVDDRTPGLFARKLLVGDDLEGGRGLLIVDAVSQVWGTSADGRITWAELIAGTPGARSS